jgi:hypothetical protein
MVDVLGYKVRGGVDGWWKRAAHSCRTTAKVSSAGAMRSPGIHAQTAHHTSTKNPRHIFPCTIYLLYSG